MLRVTLPDPYRAKGPVIVRDKAKERSSDATVNLTVVRSVALGFLVGIINLIVVERNDRLLLGRGPFLQVAVLAEWEKVLFCLCGVLQTAAFVTTLSLLLTRLCRRLGDRRAALAPAVVAGGLASVIAVQYRVLRYFKDGIDLALIRALGGGSLRDALHYAAMEVEGILPLLVAGVCLMVGTVYVLHRSAARLGTARLRARRWISPKSVVAVNVGLLCGTALLGALDREVSVALDYFPAHYIYSVVANRLTDFDFDGWGPVSSPPDFAPFHSSQHPYALDRPGNGVDEDGVGGDLTTAAVESTRRSEQDLSGWDGRALKRMNVMLIVVESARADLLDLLPNGEPILPALSRVPGQRLQMFSDVAYTGPATIAMMTGAADGSDRLSLVQRFRGMGYQVGIFSGQNESFGKVDAIGHFQEAHAFFDARSFPKDLRLYTSTAAGALAFPTPTVNSAFASWLAGLPREQPFFAYLDWQELHFPYHPNNGPQGSGGNFIPRHKITAENRDWLRQTYCETARQIDDALAGVIALLRSRSIFDNTIVLIIGDHGEELFDNGRLGHGTSISFEQNAVLCKLLNSQWAPPQTPLTSSQVPTILYNSLARSAAEARKLSDEAFCYTHTLDEPREIGIFTTSGLVKYDFRNSRWLRQRRPGPFEASQPEYRISTLWEAKRWIQSSR